MKSVLASLNRQTEEGEEEQLTPMQRLKLLKQAKENEKQAKLEEERRKQQEEERLASLSSAEQEAHIQEQTALFKTEAILNAILGSNILNMITLSETDEGGKQAISRLLNNQFTMPNGRKELLLYNGIPHNSLEAVVQIWQSNAVLAGKDPEKTQRSIKKTYDFLMPYMEGTYEVEYKLHLEEGPPDQSITPTTAEKDALKDILSDQERLDSFIRTGAKTTLDTARDVIKQELLEKTAFLSSLAVKNYNKKRAVLVSYNLPSSAFPEETGEDTAIHYRKAYSYTLPKCAIALSGALEKIVVEKREHEYLPAVSSFILNPMFWQTSAGSLYIISTNLIGKNIFGRDDAPGSKDVHKCLEDIITSYWNQNPSEELSFSQVREQLPILLNILFDGIKTEEEQKLLANTFLESYLDRFIEYKVTQIAELKPYLKELRTSQEVSEKKITELRLQLASNPTSKSLPLQISTQEKRLNETIVGIAQGSAEKKEAEELLPLLQDRDRASIDRLNINELTGSREKSAVDLSKTLLQVVHTREIAAFKEEIFTPEIARIDALFQKEQEIAKIIAAAETEVTTFLKEVMSKAGDAHAEKLSGRDDTYKLSEEKQREFEEYRAKALSIPQLHTDTFEEQRIQIQRCIDVSLGNVVTIPSEDKKELKLLSRQLSESEDAKKAMESSLDELNKKMLTLSSNKENKEALAFAKEVLMLLIAKTKDNKEQKQYIARMVKAFNDPTVLETQLTKLRGPAQPSKTWVETVSTANGQGAKQDR